MIIAEYTLWPLGGGAVKPETQVQVDSRARISQVSLREITAKLLV